jgi:hypothetical protein
MPEIKLREVERAADAHAIVFQHKETGERVRRYVVASVLEALRQDPVTLQRQVALEDARLYVAGIGADYRPAFFLHGILRVNTSSGLLEEGDILVRDERLIDLMVPGEAEPRDYECPPYTLTRGGGGEITISPDPVGISIKDGVLIY